MLTATKVKKLDGFAGDVSLYKLVPPLNVKKERKGAFGGKVEYVVVSATIVMFSGAETHIFPADKNGEIRDWGELDGSYHGGLSHREALKGAGYSMN